jgi:acetyl-CoA acetyltransferase family protein
MPEAVVVSAVRTPIGRAGKGALRSVRADDLAAVAVRAAVERAKNLDLASIEDVIVGCAFPEGEQGMNVARIVTALAGLPVTAGAMTVNRFCASSLSAFNLAAQSILLGQGEAIVVGGVESMSRVPMGGFNPSFNPKLAGSTEGIEICGLPGKRTTEFLQAYIPMGNTAENLANRYDISRADQDAFALRSHQRAIAATDAGIFAREIVPVPLPDGTTLSTDEGPRRDTSLEKLAALEPAFAAGGTVTAGNSSPLNDGASGAVLMSAEKAREMGVPPRARVLAMAVMGVAPEIMGIGPVEAVRRALARANLQLADIDVIELNEAFAAQSLAVVRELGIDENKLNPHGGAIALGHPLGSSGCRLIATLLNDLETSGGRLGMATLCVGGGQGVATILERL